MAIIFVAAILYSAEIGTNPPGLYIDESSVAFNAHSIAQTGKDEHGILFPLYFRAFGEYKNPAYIYLLAIFDKLFGPSTLLARCLSVLVGFAAAILLGFLAMRLSGDRSTGYFVAALTMFEPWLFEMSRFVYEAALFPVVLALFLFWLHGTHSRGRWSFADGLRLAIGLGLLTYTYSIGRVLGPLLAIGLVLFVSRSNWTGIVRTWCLYALTLVPLASFVWCNPTALISRFNTVSYIRPDSSWAEIALGFVAHYIANWNPRKWLLPGFESLTEHTPAQGGVLAALFVLFVVGLFVILRDHRRDPWWRYVLFGLVVSVIPASFTTDDFHTLRLIGLPIFLILVSVPALVWLRTEASPPLRQMKRTALIVLIVAAFTQIGWFQYWFHTKGGDRTYEFEAGYPIVLDAALKNGERRIYLYDRDGYPSYIHAYWYSTLQGVDLSRFERRPSSVIPEPGELILGTAYPCERCRVISHIDHFNAYFYEDPER
ncbi:MAG TPA: glycosyltransferase family 39 protein [Pyrinomonadaceae bacterium]|nr:glycosyltransferase family 39 protein [Pyrinomonadaceae bacterium]